MANLENVKVGDSVCYHASNIEDSMHILVVSRITKTLIVCGDHRFNINTGYVPGDNFGFRRSYIEPLTVALSEKIQLQRARRFIKSIPDLKFDDKQVVQFSVIMKKLLVDLKVIEG